MSHPFAVVELTPEQHKKWSDTRAAMVWHAPAFTHIFYTMMSKQSGEHLAVFTECDGLPEDQKFPTAATDGAHLLLRPSSFFNYDLKERVFIVCHEISHGMFAHCELMQKLSQTGKVKYPDGKVLDYDGEDMNKAMDYIINDMLIQSNIGQYNSNWLHDTVKGKHDDDALTVYRRIHEERMQNGGKPSGKPGQGGFDKHLKPGTTTGQDPNAAAQGRNEMEWKTAIAGGLAAAKAQGKLPSALKRFLEEQLEPKVDWTDKFQGWVARKLGGGGYNWRSPDRRLITRNIIAPARSGFGCGDIVIGGDTSGSVTDQIVAMFFGEMGGMFSDIRPRRMFIMWCDAKVHRVDELHGPEDLYDVRKAGAPGGGGTSFVPVFQKIQKMGIEPDGLIYLTDGDGTFPQRPPLYPVLWGDISGRPEKYPFGEVVTIPVR